MNQISRCFKVLEILAGHEHTGLTCTQVAKELNVTTRVSLRDLLLLADAGVTERFSHNKFLWRNTAKISLISNKVQQGYLEAINKIEQINNLHRGI